MRVTRVLRSHLEISISNSGNTRDVLEELVGQGEADDCLRPAVALLSVPVVVGILRRRLLLDEGIDSRSDMTS